MVCTSEAASWLLAYHNTLNKSKARSIFFVSAPKPSPNGEFPLQSFGSSLQSSNGGNPLVLGHQVSSSSLLMGANSLLNNSGRTNFTNKQLTELEKVKRADALALT